MTEGWPRPVERRWLGLLPARAPTLWVGQVIALSCVLVAAGLSLLTARGLGGDLPFITFLPVVLVAAVWGGYLAGVTATLASAALGTVFFVQTHPHWTPGSYALTALACVLAGGLLVLVGAMLTRTVRALARSENRFRSLTEASSLVVISLDAAAERLAPNPQWRRMTGQTDERKPGAWRAALHPEDAGKLPAKITSGLQLEVRLKQAKTADYRWVRLSLAPVTDGGTVVEWLGALEDIHDRKSDQEMSRTLAEELAHRAKSGVAVVRAIVSQSARQAATVQELEQSVISRIDAMAVAQEVVSGEGNDSAPLESLINKTISPFGLDRFSVTHEAPATLGRQLAVTLGLMLHELATNAVKYGALSVLEGRVTITNAQPTDGLARITWRESGGPPVVPTSKVGFGGRLLQAGLATFGGRGELQMKPAGIVCVLTFKA